MSQEDVDLYLAKLEDMGPATLKYYGKSGGKKYDPNTLKEIKDYLKPEDRKWIEEFRANKKK
jgi:hypothetical protein